MDTHDASRLEEKKQQKETGNSLTTKAVVRKARRLKRKIILA